MRILTSKPLPVLFPLPGIPAVRIHSCPLRKFILKLKIGLHVPPGGKVTKLLCACLLWWVDWAEGVCLWGEGLGNLKGKEEPQRVFEQGSVLTWKRKGPLLLLL